MITSNISAWVQKYSPEAILLESETSNVSNEAVQSRKRNLNKWSVIIPRADRLRFMKLLTQQLWVTFCGRKAKRSLKGL